MEKTKITFVLIKNKQVHSAQTIEADKDSIAQGISKIQALGLDSAVAVYGNGSKWDISYPMTDAQIENTALKLYRNVIL